MPSRQSRKVKINKTLSFRRVFFAPLLIVSLHSSKSIASESHSRLPPERCPFVSLSEDIHPALDQNEITLICGTGVEDTKSAEGWKTIPKDQALTNLRDFLQSRGYLNPTSQETASSRGPVTVVSPGRLVTVSEIQVEGSPAGFDVSKRRRVLGEPLTPKLLTALEQWSKDRLNELGYACAQVSTAAEPSTGKVRLTIHSGDLFFIQSIHTTELENFDSGVLRRYDPFAIGSRYNSDLLAISADRAATEGIVERTFFVPVCPSPAEVKSSHVTAGKSNQTPGIVEQHSVVGGRQILSLGVSVNSEEIARVHASAERVRIGSQASNASVEFEASNRVQELSAFFNWRFQGGESTASLRPSLDLKRQSEAPFETQSEKFQLGYTRQWDFAESGLGWVFGPQIESIQTRRGIGPSDAHDVGFGTQLQWTSHEYEFNRTKLGQGYRVSLEADGNDKSVQSSFSATRVSTKGEILFNVGNFDPPALVVSLRAGVAVVATGSDGDTLDTLPVNDRLYLGGNSDLRGFGRLELPNSGVGGLSSAFTSLEVRPDLIGDRLTPIAFVDLGEIGNSSSSSSSPLYWSPGLGLSWESPVGTLKGTVAHGFQAGSSETPSSHWQFYLSLGEQL